MKQRVALFLAPAAIAITAIQTPDATGDVKTSPIKVSTASATTATFASPQCAKGVIADVMQKYIGALGLTIDLQSTWVKYEKDVTHKKTGLARFPQPGKVTNYSPARWESRGFLHPDDITGPSRIRIDRRLKGPLMSVLIDDADKKNCTRFLHKKNDKGEDVEHRVCGKFDGANPDCKPNCARTMGFHYSSVLDEKIGSSPVVRGAILGSACVTNLWNGQERTTSAFPRDGSIGSNVVDIVDNPNAKKLLLANKEMWNTPYGLGAPSPNDPTLAKQEPFFAALAKGGALSIDACASSSVHVYLPDGINIPFKVKNHLKDENGTPMSADGCVWDEKKTFSCKSPAAVSAWAAKWLAKWKAVLLINSPEVQKKWSEMTSGILQIKLMDDYWKWRSKWESALTKATPYCMSILVEMQTSLDQIQGSEVAKKWSAKWKDLMAAVDAVAKKRADLCQCPMDKRANIYVSDAGNETHIQFHVGWFRLQILKLAILVVGFEEMNQVSISSVVSEDNLRPIDATNPTGLYQKEKDPVASTDPFAPGGLFFIPDKCLPFLMKPGLDVLYVCTADNANACNVGPTNDPKDRKFSCGKSDCCPCPSVQGINLVEMYMCRDQLRKAMILAHEAPFDPADGNRRSEEIMSICREKKTTVAEGHEFGLYNCATRQGILATVGLAREACLKKVYSPSAGPGGGFKLTSAMVVDEKCVKDLSKKWLVQCAQGTTYGAANYSCKETLRAASYRGHVPPCFATQSCKDLTEFTKWKGEMDVPPPPIPRSMLAAENARRRGAFTVVPGEKPGFFNIRLQIRPKGEGVLKLKLHHKGDASNAMDEFLSRPEAMAGAVLAMGVGAPIVNLAIGALPVIGSVAAPLAVLAIIGVAAYTLFEALFDSTLGQDEWREPVEVKVNAALDVVASPYAYIGPNGKDPALGIELAMHPKDVSLANKNKVIKLMCKDHLVWPLSELCESLVKDLVGGIAINRAIATLIQWIMSASLVDLLDSFGLQKTTTLGIAQEALATPLELAKQAIDDGIGKLFGLWKTSPLQNVLDGAKAEQCVRAFIKFKRLDCKEVAP